MKNMWNRLVNQEEGNVAVLFALMLVVLCGMAAMAIDGGVLFFEKSRLQKSIDAAALAGAQELLVGQAQAESEAISYSGKNGYTITGDNVATGTNFIEVSESVNKELTFARVLGVDNTEVPAFARAQLSGTLKKREGIIPVGLEVTEFSRESSYTLHFQPGNGKGNEKENGPIKGNFGFLDIGDDEYKTTRDKIKYGITMEISNEMLEMTEPGLRWGQINQGFEYRINEDLNKRYCHSYATADDSCARTVIVPLVETYADVNGKSEIKIVGFAAFWIESISQHEVNGRFIDIVTYGEFSEKEDENEYGVYGVRLVQ